MRKITVEITLNEINNTIDALGGVVVGSSGFCSSTVFNLLNFKYFKGDLYFYIKSINIICKIKNNFVYLQKKEYGPDNDIYNNWTLVNRCHCIIW